MHAYFGGYLKKDTAATLHLLLLDKNDGFTNTNAIAPETGVTLGQFDAIQVWKQGATAATSLAATSTLTHRANGVYTLTLSATDTDTLGSLLLVALDYDAVRPVVIQFTVIPADMWNAQVGGTVKMPADVLRINGVQAAAEFLGDLMQGGVSGTAVAGTLTTAAMTTDLSETTNDHYNGKSGIFISGVLTGQVFTVNDYTGSTKLITFAASLTDSPSEGDQFVLF